MGMKPERFVPIRVFPNETSYPVTSITHTTTGFKMSNITTLPKLLNEHETAEILTVKVATLRRWRWSGDGPTFIKVGAAVRYDPRVIERYLAERVRSSTSDPGNQAA